MNINLGPQWEGFISESVESGRYVSASEVVRDGLRLLQEREQLRQLKLDSLRAQVDKGIEQLDNGEFVQLDENGLNEYLEDVDRRGRERLGRSQRRTT